MMSSCFEKTSFLPEKPTTPTTLSLLLLSIRKGEKLKASAKSKRKRIFPVPFPSIGKDSIPCIMRQSLKNCEFVKRNYFTVIHILAFFCQLPYLRYYRNICGNASQAIRFTIGFEIW